MVLLILVFSQSVFSVVELDGGIRQGDFNDFVRDFGAVHLFKNMQSPKNIGNGKEAIGLEYAISSVDETATHWENSYRGEAPENFNSVKLKYHRGLSGHGDLSASLGKTDNFYFFSVDHKDVFLKHKSSLFGALRPTVNIGTVPNEVWIFTPGLDLSFGYEVTCFAPYFTYGFAFPYGFAEVDRGLLTTKEIIQKINAGISVLIKDYYFVAEYELSEINTVSFSLRVLY